MMQKNINYYEKFRNSSLDTSAVGLTVDSEFSYFGATPVGAKVIALADVYGIHFCQKEDGDAVYVVEPDSDAEAVHKVARNFPEFMGLIIACSHASVLWQVHEMTRKEFDAYIQSNKPSMKQRSVLRAISNIYHPPVVADPYSYLKNLK